MGISGQGDFWVKLFAKYFYLELKNIIKNLHLVIKNKFFILGHGAEFEFQQRAPLGTEIGMHE